MHNAGMTTTQLTIRHVPESVRDELAVRAARSGQSMQEYLLAEIERLVRRPSVADWAEKVRHERKGRGPLTRRQILAHRDADRR